jgi:hypothetical protein
MKVVCGHEGLSCFKEKGLSMLGINKEDHLNKKA